MLRWQQAKRRDSCDQRSAQSRQAPDARAGDRARRILEIGTLGGYGTIWLARGLPPGGRLITLEANPAYAEIARANVARAGFGAMVEVRVGKAIDTLPGLAAEAPFDLIFIDADKKERQLFPMGGQALTPRLADYRG
jgi:predicted O-methyltransferase YrrM